MDLKKIQKALKVNFKDLDLLKCALTHPSTELEYSYERLEFLGDAILSAAIAEMLYCIFPLDTEGDLSKKHVKLVCKDTLAEISKDLGLGKYLFLSVSEERTGGREKLSNLENTLEALIGAIFLDSGFKTARSFIHKHWHHMARAIKCAPANPKNILQEIAQKKGLDLPNYKLVEKSGQDHSPIFKVTVKMGQKSGIGTATSKRIAEQNAAKNLLKNLETGHKKN